MVATRPAIGLADQLLSSATNVVFVFVLARLLDASAFGTFVVGMSVTLLVAGVARAFVGEPLLALVSTMPHADGEGADRHRMIRSALVTAFLAGVGACVVISGVGLALGGVAGELWYTAICLPALLLQDAARYAYLAIGRPAVALRSDLVWLVVQSVLVVVVMLTTGRPGALAFALCWAGGALAAAAWVLVEQRLDLRDVDLRAWLRFSRVVSAWRVVTSVVGQVQQQGVVVLIGVLLTTADAGGLRVGQLMVAQPVTTVAAAVVTAMVPWAARRGDAGDRHGLRSSVRRLETAAAGVAAGVLGVYLLRVPLVALLFPGFERYAGLLGPVCVQAACVCVSSPLQAVARGLRVLRPLFVAQVVAAVVAVGATVAGSLVAGVTGAAWGPALGAAVVVVGSVLAYRSGLRDLPDDGSLPPPPRRSSTRHALRR